MANLVGSGGLPLSLTIRFLGVEDGVLQIRISKRGAFALRMLGFGGTRQTRGLETPANVLINLQEHRKVLADRCSARTPTGNLGQLCAQHRGKSVPSGL